MSVIRTTLIFKWLFIVLSNGKRLTSVCYFNVCVVLRWRSCFFCCINNFKPHPSLFKKKFQNVWKNNIALIFLIKAWKVQVIGIIVLSCVLWICKHHLKKFIELVLKQLKIRPFTFSEGKSRSVVLKPVKEEPSFLFFFSVN